MNKKEMEEKIEDLEKHVRHSDSVCGPLSLWRDGLLRAIEKEIGSGEASVALKHAYSDYWAEHRRWLANLEKE